MTKIHPSAYVSSKAVIEDEVEVGPYSYIGDGVIIKRGAVISSSVRIEGDTEIGEGTEIGHGSAIGLPPQDLSFKGEKSRLVIGKDNRIREFVTIHRATGEGEETRIGDRNFIMDYVHIAHNCRIGSDVVLVNMAQLAGYVEVMNYAYISGLVAFHQYVRVGEHAFIGGFSRVTQDVPPYLMALGIPLRVIGVNVVGLRRRGFPSDVIMTLRKAYKLIYRSGLNLSQALNRIREELPITEELKNLLGFIETSKRGITLKSGEGEDDG